MKRKLLAFSATLALLLSVFTVANVGAHTVTIERGTTVPSRTDWFGVQPDTGQGAIMRNQAQQGEFIFNDATKEHRQISATNAITREADLDWFGVTADGNNVYFLAKVENYSGIANDPSIELLITIDTDHASSALPSKTQLPITPAPAAQVSVPSSAAWEYAVDTKFSPGAPGVKFVTGSTTIWTNDAATQTPNPCVVATCPSQLAAASITQGSFVEISVPWTSITPGGVKPPASVEKFLRFTVSTMYSNHALPTDGFGSPVIDVLGIGKTIDDIGDGTMADTDAFDVHFDTNPAPTTPTYEPYAPLQITEIQPNPIGTDTPGPTNTSTESEWIEIYNPNAFAVTLTDYKIGNAAKRSTAASNTQGMFKFKDSLSTARKSISSKATIIVAKFKSRFLAGHPGFDANKVYDLSGTSDFTKYTAWSNGSAILLDNSPTAPATTFEEQVLLLDAKDDIADLVNYGNPTVPTPGNVPVFSVGVPEGASFERCPAGLDTNGGFVDKNTQVIENADFVTHDSVAAQTPGIACVGRPGVDLQLVKTANVANGQSGDPVVFTLSYSNIGSSNDPSGTATITDTLPTGLTFVSASVAPTTHVGQNLSWNVTAPNAGGLATEIQVTATINNGLGTNVPLVNTAGITSANEPTDPVTRSNNAAQATVTTLGPALLQPSFFFSGLGSNTPPNSTFEFTLNFGNTGQDDATDTSISLTVPANITILSATADGATANFTTPINGPTTLTWSVGDLPTNDQGSITLKARVGSGATTGAALPFAAQIQGVSGDSTPVSATANGSQTVGFNKTYMPFNFK